MAKTIRQLMTTGPVTVEDEASLQRVAAAMRDMDIGNVLVTHDGKLRGVVTDRDIVVRAIAGELDPKATTAADIVSDELVTVGPDDADEDAVRLMREHAVRRLPVVEDGIPIGIVSLGDLALDKDPDSALGQISAEPPNR